MIMKKILLTAAIAMLASTGFAQTGSQLSKKEAVKVAVQADLTTVGRKATVNQRRSIANGTYYTRPQGMMFFEMTKEGGGYSPSVLVIPPFYQTTFKNQCGTNEVSWTMNDKDFNAYAYPETGDCDYYYFGRSTTDEDGLNLYYVPTIHKGNNSFTICEEYPDGELNEEGAAAGVPDETNDIGLSFNDLNSNYWYGSGAIDPASKKKSTDRSYIFGPGTITFSDGSTWNSVGVAQVFPAPVTPLTVNEVVVHAVTNTRPLTGDAVLYMEVRDVEVDEQYGPTFGTETIETLVCTAEDCNIAYTLNGTDYWNMCFHKKVEDDFGIEMDAPFVLDKEFSLVVIGFDGQGCDAGMMGISMANEDTGVILEAEPIIENDGRYTSFNYMSPISLDASFFGFFDAVNVPDQLSSYDEEGNIMETYDKCNVLRVSADGATVTNECSAEAFDAYVYVEFARALTDEDENDNYTFDTPDWVKDIVIAASSTSEKDGTYFISVVCDPLPEGETGRSAAIFVKGSGVTSENPIYVLQGDATYETGIKEAASQTVSNSNHRYSLNGVRLNNNFKGIVIQNGRKFIQK